MQVLKSGKGNYMGWFTDKKKETDLVAQVVKAAGLGLECPLCQHSTFTRVKQIPFSQSHRNPDGSFTSASGYKPVEPIVGEKTGFCSHCMAMVAWGRKFGTLAEREKGYSHMFGYIFALGRFTAKMIAQYDSGNSVIAYDEYEAFLNENLKRDTDLDKAALRAFIEICIKEFTGASFQFDT